MIKPDYLRFRRRPALALAWLALSFTLGLFTAVPAADDNSRRGYDLPADSAERSLMLFSKQSGRGVIAGAEAVKEVRTNAVKGQLTASDALAQLLAGTGLVATLDGKTGAFAVRKEGAGPNAPGAVQPNGGDRPASPEPVAGAGSLQGTGAINGRVKNAVTGKYLNNARVAVRGTDLVVFTDDFGIYRLVNVPGGTVTLEAFYTDLDVQQVDVQVAGGGAVERDFALTSQARYGESADVVKLGAYLVSSDKDTDAQSIATNEQRFAPNIKNVMSTDALGDILGSNVGEFLKFIPGITAQYDNADTIGISVRGIGGDMTAFTSNGAPIANGWNGGGRDFNLNSIALNNFSRIEVTKVPTPSVAADSLAGSVNLVSKSAFERSGAILHYGVNLVANSEDVTFDKTPHSFRDRNTRKIHAGFDFDYTLPIGKTFGIVLAGVRTAKFNEQHLSPTSYNTGGTNTGASLSRPYLQTHRLRDGPRDQTRTSFSIKADWRVTPYSVLSIGAQSNRVEQQIGLLTHTTSTGTVGTPSVAAGQVLTFGPTFVNGATGRGTVSMTTGDNRLDGGTKTANLNYRFDDGRWRIESGLSISSSWASRRNNRANTFVGVTASLIPAVRVNFAEINRDHPGTVTAFDNANRQVDIYDIANYRITGATDTPYENEASFKSASLNVRRRLNVFPFPSAIQVGGLQRVQGRDVRPESMAWTFNGPDGNPATNDSAAPYLTQVYRNQDPKYGFPRHVPWISPSRLWEANRANPILLTQSNAQRVAQESYRVTNSEYVEETVSAAYVQGEAGFLNNRLKFLAGVRFERTEDEGEGLLSDPNAVYARRADGIFNRDAAGNRIRKPEAGVAGSMEELRLIQREREAKARRSYDGYYPSFHATYDLRENFLVRAAYAKTYGRPNFTDIIPRTIINERDLTEEEINDPAVVRGNITVRNTSLKPWSADNLDLSFEYYTPQGGLVSAGVFLKEIKDFFGNSVKLATQSDLAELGLEPRYAGWNISTKFNAGDASITGAEFNVRHSLRSIGTWGRYFTAFANATKLDLKGNQQASFTSFIPESANWGVSFSRANVNLTARWNYRGLDKRRAQPLFGPDGFEYYEARTTLDVNGSLQLSRRLALMGSVNNLLNVPQTLLRYGSQTPAYARQAQTSEYGVSFTVGLKGSW